VPKVYIQDSKDINAFAAGLKPEAAIVCVTTGALDQLNQEELEGVIAHEMSHVLNKDMRLATLTIAIVGAIAMIAEIGLRIMWMGGGRRERKVNPIVIVIAIVGIILAPILARLTYLFLSRRREYLADASGARLTRNPVGLADALRKIRGDVPDDPQGSKTVAGLYFANPWTRKTGGSIWSTHPPLEERIERLEKM
jgi:heat shock protein HtpX